MAIFKDKKATKAKEAKASIHPFIAIMTTLLDGLATIQTIGMHLYELSRMGQKTIYWKRLRSTAFFAEHRMPKLLFALARNNYYLEAHTSFDASSLPYSIESFRILADHLKATQAICLQAMATKPIDGWTSADMEAIDGTKEAAGKQLILLDGMAQYTFKASIHSQAKTA